MTKTRQLGCFLMVLGALALPALGQGGGGGGGRGGGGGGAGFRQQMMDQLKGALGATDDEFKALQPKIEQISSLRRDLHGRNGARRPRRSRRWWWWRRCC